MQLKPHLEFDVKRFTGLFKYLLFFLTQYCGSGIFIPDLESESSIPDPGSKIKKIPDPDPHQRI
jgi:hypothetical protein